MYELILGLGMGFKETPAEQMKIAKSVGWDGIFTGWSKSENLEDYAKCAEEQGLIYQSVHAPFGNVAQTGDSITWLDDSHLLPFDGVGDWNGIADRLKKAGYKNHLTFELTSKNKPERNTHDIYAHLDCQGFVALALERAKKFRSILEAK